MDAVEKVKIELSANDETKIKIDSLINNHDFSDTITRDQLDLICSDLKQ